MKICCLAISALLLTGAAFFMVEEINPIDHWVGKTRDETHKAAGPESGIIVDAETWTNLWSKWHADDEVPEVDFSVDMILVATVSGPNQMMIGKIELNDGNLALRSGATRMGGPGFGHLLVQVSRAGITSVNGVPVPDSAGLSDSISVNIVGTLRTGVMAIGGESTGTTITANNVTWELQLTAEQGKKSESLNGSKVHVKGELNKKRGVEIAERWIVTVSAIGSPSQEGDEGQSDETHGDLAFKTIVFETSGGFAGIKQTLNIKANGKVAGRTRTGEQREVQWPKQKMADLHKHISDTDWNQVPAETRNRNVADDFQHDFTIDFGKSQMRFTIDGTSLPQVPALERLMELIR